jgi:hypothetical protein
MNCFNHKDKPAIGLCKSCGKGLCGDCLTEVPNGLACKDSCEDRVEMMNFLADKISQTLVARKRLLRQYGLLTMLLGIGFIIFGTAISWQLPAFPYLPYFSGFVGGVFIIFGVLVLRRKEPYPQSKRQNR